MLEKKIERACCLWAHKQHKIRNIKLTNQVGIPDRLFMYNGKVLFVEFKAPGETPRLKQIYEQKALTENGFSVHNIDSVEQFKTIIERWVHD